MKINNNSRNHKILQKNIMFVYFIIRLRKKKNNLNQKPVARYKKSRWSLDSIWWRPWKTRINKNFLKNETENKKILSHFIEILIHKYSIILNYQVLYIQILCFILIYYIYLSSLFINYLTIKDIFIIFSLRKLMSYFFFRNIFSISCSCSIKFSSLEDS
jgi:hypothetical protein